MELWKGGNLVFYELDGVLIDIYLNSKKMFQERGCYKFFQFLHGHNFQLSQAFADSFDGYQAIIGGITVKFSKESIPEVFLLAQ